MQIRNRWQDAGAAAITLIPVGPESFFVCPDEASELVWTDESGGLSDSMDYVVRDYWQREVAAGEADRIDQTIRISVKLRPGFYDVEFLHTRQRFGVVSLPAYAGRTDPFFCIDSALSWLVRDDAVCFSLARVLRRSGIDMIQTSAT